MTGPPVSAADLDPLAQLKKLKGAPPVFATEDAGKRLVGLSDPLDELKAMRGGASTLHDEFKSGHLAARMAAENAGEQALDAPAEKMGVGGALATSFANTARGLPIVAGAQNIARSVVRGEPYSQAKSEIDQATSRIPSAASRLQRMVGAAPLASVLPANPALAGGMVGAADQVFSDDPTRGIGSRAFGGVLGGAAGAVMGHTVGTGTTLARAGLAPNSSDNILTQKAARSASDAVNYGQALSEGVGKTNTPSITRVLAQPDLAEIRDGLLQTRPLANEAPNSPKVLDAIYKVLSDRSAQLKRGLETPTPTKPNLGRFNQDDIAMAKEDLLTAMSGKPGAVRPFDRRASVEPAPAYRPMSTPWPGETSGSVAVGERPNARDMRLLRAGPVRHDATALDIGGLPRSTPEDFRASLPAREGAGPPIHATGPVPPPMPSYRAAVTEHAERSGNIDATRRGQDVLRSSIGTGVTTGKNLDRTTPEAFATWAKKTGLSPDQLRHAAEGVLGATREDIAHHPFKNLLGFRAVGKAGNLLRSVDTPQQRLIDLLTKAGLASGNAALASP